MTLNENIDSYPSFEDFMSEDKLPPVFPLSQTSNLSETQIYSQHLISEACDRETCGPFGIGINDDDLPLNFINSSLAYSPKSIPPHSPSDNSIVFNLTSSSSSVLDPLDIATSDADDMLEDMTFENEQQLEDNVMDVDNIIPIVDTQEFQQYLDELSKTNDLNEGEDFSYQSILPTPSITPPSITPAPTPVIIETASVSFIKLETSESEAISPTTPTSTSDKLKINKKPATRGRKRKLFTNCEEKKKDQNKEAARRYREKKKSEDARLEAEEAILKEQNKDAKRDLEIKESTFREFVSTLKALLLDRKRRKH